jgi:hypothetical protein
MGHPGDASLTIQIDHDDFQAGSAWSLNIDLNQIVIAVFQAKTACAFRYPALAKAWVFTS